MGFEPMTSYLLDRRSNQLSYGALHDTSVLLFINIIPRKIKKRYLEKYH